MRTPKQVILSALYSARGDDLERARMAWARLPDSGLDKEHGESGKTKREHLAGWEKHRAEVDAAIRFAESL